MGKGKLIGACEGTCRALVVHVAFPDGRASPFLVALEAAR